MLQQKNANHRDQLSCFFFFEAFIYACYFIISFGLAIWSTYLNQNQLYGQNSFNAYTIVHWIVSIGYKAALVIVFFISYLKRTSKKGRKSKQLLKVWGIGYLLAQIILYLLMFFYSQLTITGALHINGSTFLNLTDLIFPVTTICILIVSGVIMKEKRFLFLALLDFIAYLVLFVLRFRIPQTENTLETMFIQPSLWLAMAQFLILFSNLFYLSVYFNKRTDEQ